CLYLFYFCFQAEDGIRDPLVTGVQTCALPISKARTKMAKVDRTLSKSDSATPVSAVVARKPRGPNVLVKPSVKHSTSTNAQAMRSEEHTSELQSRVDLVCRLLLEKKKNKKKTT